MENTTASSTTVRQDRIPFLEYPSQNRDDLNLRQCLIYLIPGNPGLIAYYEPFMRTLRQLLNEVEAKERCGYAFHVYGRNLLGFDDDDHTPTFGTATASGITTTPFTLEDQIRNCYDQVHQITHSTLSHDRSFSSVILIGHSVGSYIALELFHRAATTPHPNLTLTLHSAILLFPTITHIARSSSGRKLDLIRRTPFLDASAHHIAKGFVSLLPRWLLDAVVRRVLGFPPHAAAATLRFLMSRDGIWQALHMGKDEMARIRDEVARWGEGMWEVRVVEGFERGLEALERLEAGDDEAGDKREGKREGKVKGGTEEEGEGEVKNLNGMGRTKFFFYFAEKDHWVADECRDEFIERRRRDGPKGGTRAVVDEAGIPHAFCIHHSESVAEKVRLWIEDIAGL